MKFCIGVFWVDIDEFVVLIFCWFICIVDWVCFVDWVISILCSGSDMLDSFFGISLMSIDGVVVF